MRVEISIKVDEKVSPDGFTGGIIEPENPLPVFHSSEVINIQAR